MRCTVVGVALFVCAGVMAQQPRWSEKAANDWYAKQPWLVGANYIPATAINELEMWQADTLRPEAHRPGTRLGREHRHEHDARVPARSAVAAGRPGLPESASTSF